MALYMKFMVTLAFGLAGLAMVMKILMDRVFNDGDFLAEVGEYIKGLKYRATVVRFGRTEDVLMEAERNKPRELTTRLLDQRRERLKELNEVENLLNRPRSAAAAPAPAALRDLTSEEEFLSQN